MAFSAILLYMMIHRNCVLRSFESNPLPNLGPFLIVINKPYSYKQVGGGKHTILSNLSFPPPNCRFNEDKRVGLEISFQDISSLEMRGNVSM
jgi:hypothetical protein